MIRQYSLLNTFFTLCFGLFRFQCIDNGHNLQALHFAIQLAKYVADEKHSPHVTEVNGSIHKFSSLTTNLVPMVSHFPDPSLAPGEGRRETLKTRLTEYSFQMLLLSEKLGITSRQHPKVDECLYSPHFSAWQCVDIVNRNYRLITLNQTLPNESSGCFIL